MGPPRRTKEKGEKRDRGSIGEPRKRRLERSRRFARAAGKDLGEKPPVPREYDKWKSAIDLCESFKRRAIVDPTVESLTGLQGVGALRMPLEQARKFVEAVGELTDANRAEARNIGTFYSLNIVGRDARNAKNPHVQEGKPYTRSELRERTQGSYGDRMAWDGRTLRVETSNAPENVDQGIDGVVDVANSILKTAKSPGERRAGLQALQDSVQQRIKANRQQRLKDIQGTGM
jgi:hypothetical protein